MNQPDRPTRPPGPGGPSALSGGEPAKRRRIGDVLVQSGLISGDQLKTALDHQRNAPGSRRRLGQVITDLGMASERDVAECLANLLGLSMIDLSKTVPAPDVVRLLPRQIAERTRTLVLDRSDHGLVVATADPTNVLALDDVRLHTRSAELIVKVATDSQIREQINRAWALDQDSTHVAALTQGEADEDETRQQHDSTGDEAAPIVKLVNQILSDAVRMRASDIHIEVQRDAVRVRYRVDGVLRDMMNAPKRIATSMISRIKIVSGLDIAERRVPQDGRTRFTVEGTPIDARVSTLPSLHGEKVVIRLLSRGEAIPKLSGLGFGERQLQQFTSSLSVPQGLVLITGPTGSGKTNTLYSAIAGIQTPEKNIVTLEDPIEVQLPGITQVGVNVKAGMTFAAGLRSILRQDPDIILVGEVRDGETAELALKAAMTGHLVLTTLHTNSAVAAVTRLVDMGIEPFMVASSLTSAIAQRLVRTPCASCVQPYTPDDDTLTLLGMSRRDLAGAQPRKGVGCPECGGTGYRGRTAVYEVLVVDSAMRQVLLTDPRETAIAAAARAAGMTTLRGSALEKAMLGLTTFEEALRVTHSDQIGTSVCPACHRSVEQGMVACPWCATTIDRGRCTSCAKPLEVDWKICPWCRTPASPPTAKPPATSRPAAAAASPTAPARSASASSASAPSAPPQAAPAQAAPVQRPPVQGQPAQRPPAQGQPTHGQPVQRPPAQGQPTQGQPVQRPVTEGQPAQGRRVQAQPAAPQPGQPERPPAAPRQPLPTRVTRAIPTRQNPPGS